MLDAEQANKETIALIKQELNKVVQERDLLANRLKVDIDHMDEKIVTMKSEYESILVSLNVQVRELREENETKQAELDQVSGQLASKCAMYDDLNKQYSVLELKIDELKKQTNLEYETKLKECEMDFMEKVYFLILT